MKRHLFILLLALAIVIYPAAAIQWRSLSDSGYFNDENRFVNELSGYQINYSSIDHGRAIYEVDFTSSGETEVSFILTHYDGSKRIGTYKRSVNFYSTNNTIVLDGTQRSHTGYGSPWNPTGDTHPYGSIQYTTDTDNESFGLGICFKVIGGGKYWLGFNYIFDNVVIPTDSLLDNPIIRIDATVISGDPVRIWVSDAYIDDIAGAQEKTKNIGDFSNNFLNYIAQIVDNLFLGLWIIKFIFIDNIIALVVFIEGFGFLWALWTKGDIILSLKVFMGYNRELMTFFLDLISKLKPW